MTESTAATDDGEEAFFQELDKFQLHIPGNKTIPFSEDQNLLDMVQRQYPGWKERSRITSVPIARIPKILLHNLQLHKDLQKKLKSTLKGDEGEMNLYTMFVDGSFVGEPGMIVFPNVDGSHVFETQIAKVEIDMVLVHSKKGIFVFNVKNQTGKGSSPHDVQNDIENHKKFIRMLLDYNNNAENEIFPIHSVVCDFANEKSKFTTLEHGNKNKEEKIVVLNKTELKKNQFCRNWESKISAAGIENIAWNSSLDKLVARLIALASIESSSALIHEQVRIGFAQAVTSKELLQTQMEPLNSSCSVIKGAILHHSQVENERGKKKFILWTKEQLEVIAKVCQHLSDSDSSKRGIRLLVTGGKGSGKTMSLIALAKLAATIIEERSGEHENTVLVCEGTGKSTGLRMMLKRAFLSTSVIVIDLPGDGAFWEKQLQMSKMVFCDETLPNLYQYFLDRISEKQHAVFFSSDKKAEVQRNFVIVHLSSGLRSTCQITNFANAYCEKGPRNVFLASPISKVQGEPVEVQLVELTQNDQLTQELFLSKCINGIRENAEKCIGSDFFVVVPFVTSNTLHLIIKSLETKQYVCYPNMESFAKGSFIGVRSRPENVDVHLPAIVFCQPDEIEGCEFSTVLVLLDTEIFETFIFPLYGSPILTAVTRASLKVVMIVKELIVPKDDSMSNTLISDQTKKLLDVIDFVRQMPSDHPSVLFVGRIVNATDFRKAISSDNISVPKIEGLSIYKVQKGSFFHISDIYLEKDLEQIYSLGVRQCYISTESVTCPWEYFYLMASTICVRNFSLRTNNSLRYKALVYNISLRKYRLKFHLAFLRQQAGIPDVIFPDFWMLEFQNHPMPLTEELSWHKWKAKAEELLRINEIAPAAFIFECSIKSLSQKLQVNIDAALFELIENDKKHLAALLSAVSKIYIERMDDLVQGTRFDYQYQPLHPESCLIKALRHAVSLLEVAVSHHKAIEKIEVAIRRLKQFSEKINLKNPSTKRATNQNYGMIFESFPLKPHQLDNALHFDLDLEIKHLNSMVFSYERKTMKENQANLSKLRNEISLFAVSSSNKALGLMRATCAARTNESSSHQSMFNQIKQTVDYPLQLMLLALHWDCSIDCTQNLFLVVDSLDNAVDELKSLDEQEAPSISSTLLRNRRDTESNEI